MTDDGRAVVAAAYPANLTNEELLDEYVEASGERYTQPIQVVVELPSFKRWRALRKELLRRLDRDESAQLSTTPPPAGADEGA